MTWCMKLNEMYNCGQVLMSESLQHFSKLAEEWRKEDRVAIVLVWLSRLRQSPHDPLLAVRYPCSV